MDGEQRFDRELDRAYYNIDSPSYLAGQRPVLKQARKSNKSIRLAHVVEYLHRQDAYTYHKPQRRRFARNRTIPVGFLTDIQIDLIDMSSVANQNQGQKWILAAKDVLTRYAWARALPDKSAATVTAAFKEIVETMPKPPWTVWSDQGTEFTNQIFQKYLSSIDVKHVTPFSSPDLHMSSIENWNKVLKVRLWRHFTHKKRNVWTKYLQKIVTAINSSYCRAINARPIDITAANAGALWKRLYGKDGRTPKRPPAHPHHPRVKVGSTVRVAAYKNAFRKSYTPGWTQEVFTVVRILEDRVPKVYMLADHNKQPIKGVYYAEEIVPVIRDSNSVYEIEKILQRKKTKTGEKLLVLWQGYGSEFSSWINANDLVSTDTLND